MSNKIFYKALATVSTVGIVVIAGIQVTTALKKGNNAEDQLAKTMVELKNARKNALTEIKSIRSEVLKELDNVRSNSLKELKIDRSNALVEVNTAKQNALKSIGKAGGGDEGKVWLVLKYGGWKTGYMAGFDPAIEKIPMRDMDQCQIMGAQWISSPRAFDGRYNYEKMAFICLEE